MLGGPIDIMIIIDGLFALNRELAKLWPLLRPGAATALALRLVQEARQGDQARPKSSQVKSSKKNPTNVEKPRPSYGTEQPGLTTHIQRLHQYRIKIQGEHDLRCTPRFKVNYHVRLCEFDTCNDARGGRTP